MLVGDKKASISSFYVYLEEFSIDDQLVAFSTDDQACVDYMLATFAAGGNKQLMQKRSYKEHISGLTRSGN